MSMSTLSFIVIGSDVVVSVVVVSVVVGSIVVVGGLLSTLKCLCLFLCVFVIAIALTVANVTFDVFELQAS